MCLKQTQDDFIEKSKNIFNNLDYSKVKYINSKTNIILVCKTHKEEFTIQPGPHLSYKRGCPYCSNHLLHFDDFKKHGKDIHKDKYDYSKVVWKNVKTKVNIICKIHGEFWQTPDKHLNNEQGCPKCKIDFVRHVLNVRYSYEKYLLSQCEELGVKFIDDPDKWC
jgi:hypothetical protein